MASSSLAPDLQAVTMTYHSLYKRINSTAVKINRSKITERPKLGIVEHIYRYLQLKSVKSTQFAQSNFSHMGKTVKYWL